MKGFVKYFSREVQAWSVRGGKTRKLQLLKLFWVQSRKWRILLRNWSRNPHFTLIKAYLVNDEKLNLNIGIFGDLGRWSSHPIRSRVIKLNRHSKKIKTQVLALLATNRQINCVIGVGFLIVPNCMLLETFPLWNFANLFDPKSIYPSECSVILLANWIKIDFKEQKIWQKPKLWLAIIHFTLLYTELIWGKWLTTWPAHLNLSIYKTCDPNNRTCGNCRPSFPPFPPSLYASCSQKGRCLIRIVPN